MKRRRALRQAGPTSCYTPRVRFGEQSELHAILAGKGLLNLRRRMRPREWREWVTKARIPNIAIAKFLRAAEALEVTAYLAK